MGQSSSVQQNFSSDDMRSYLTSSWKAIILKSERIEEPGSEGTVLSGLSLFCRAFDLNKAQVREDQQFDIRKCKVTQSDMSDGTAAHPVLPLMKALLSVDSRSDKDILRIRNLGRQHSALDSLTKLRPFFNVLLLTISSRLNVDMDSEVMKAWIDHFNIIESEMCVDRTARSVVGVTRSDTESKANSGESRVRLDGAVDDI